MMQSPDTDRIKLDDREWSIQCAECGEYFFATRSDAAYCSPRCRKRAHNRPARKLAALADIEAMSNRVRHYANEWNGSQDMLDALGFLEATIKKQRAQMNVVWKPLTLPEGE